MADLFFLRPPEAFKLFAAGQPQTHYLLAGTDHVMRLELRRLLTRRHLGEENKAGRPEIHDAASTPPDRIMDVLIELSLFAERRVIVIRAAEKTLDAQRFPFLQERLQGLDAETLVILELDGSARDLLKSSLVQACVARKAGAYCYAPIDEAETVRWILAYGERNHFRIAADAAKRIIECVGIDPSEIASEIEKVAFATRGEVTLAAVRDLLKPHRDRRVFEWADAILLGEKKAVTIVENATDGGKEGIAAVAVLHRRFIEIETLRDGGFLNVIQKRFLSGVERKWPAPRLARARETLLKLDLELKSCREETRLARIELATLNLLETR